MKLANPHVTDSKRLERKDKALLLIEALGKSFKNSQYPVFTHAYEDLLRKGVRFPHPLKDEVSPVFTPAERVRRQF